MRCRHGNKPVDGYVCAACVDEAGTLVPAKTTEPSKNSWVYSVYRIVQLPRETYESYVSKRLESMSLLQFVQNFDTKIDALKYVEDEAIGPVTILMVCG